KNFMVGKGVEMSSARELNIKISQQEWAVN
ncbi:MAG: hypothetical protein ACI9KM_001726, partial [Rubritalea sp.]